MAYVWLFWGELELGEESTPPSSAPYTAATAPAAPLGFNDREVHACGRTLEEAVRCNEESEEWNTTCWTVQTPMRACSRSAHSIPHRPPPALPSVVAPSFSAETAVPHASIAALCPPSFEPESAGAPPLPPNAPASPPAPTAPHTWGALLRANEDIALLAWALRADLAAGAAAGQAGVSPLPEVAVRAGQGGMTARSGARDEKRRQVEGLWSIGREKRHAESYTVEGHIAAVFVSPSHPALTAGEV